ncbi:MAG: peptide chain release factor N(5)-glutamine methyltransferase [Terracidiphilus sp.]|jgi:release factor glutamine methyltransferase
MRLREWISYGEKQLLLGPHPDKARQDAELLLLGTIAENRAWLLAHLDESLTPQDADCYMSNLEERASGKPVQHIQEVCEFYGFPFRVSPDVLIPRPETEHIVDRAIVLMRTANRPRILDVGTGSGAIAIALSKHLSDAQITAIDLSRPALEIAELNAEQNHVLERIRFLEGDLLTPIAGEQFEIIVSNPPYVAEADRASLSVEVRDYEPALALFAGDDGLDIYRRLIPASFNSLVAGGFLLLEIGFGQSPAITELLTASGFEQIEFTPDLQGIPRVARARRPSFI